MRGPTAVRAVRRGPSAAHEMARSPDPAKRAGYAQAAAAQAAAQRDDVDSLGGRLLQWAQTLSGHVLGAFGSHGIVELDLDQPSSEL